MSFRAYDNLLKDRSSGDGSVKKEIYISIGQNRVRAEVADTYAAQIKGLGGREALAPDRAMLFVYGEPRFYGIWMKGMKFPIDILWLDKGHRIISLRERVKPSSFPDIFKPSEPASYVLEAAADFAEKNNLKIGSEIYFSL